MKEIILKFIIKYMTEHGYSPSVRDICDGVGLRSTSSVQAHLKKMAELKMIEIDGLSRAIRVPGYQFVRQQDYIPKKAVLDMLNELSGCDEGNDYSKGWDDAIDTAIDGIGNIERSMT